MQSLEIGLGFPGGSDGKESTCDAGDWSSIAGSGRYPEEGNGNLLQYSCLENPIDRGALQTTVHGIAESATPGGLAVHLDRIETAHHKTEAPFSSRS